VGLDGGAEVTDGSGNLDRLAADALGLREVAEQHERLGQRREHERAQRRGLGGHDRGRAPMLRQGAVVIAQRPRRAAQHLVDRGRDLRLLPLAETAGGGLEVGQRPVRAARGERHLGGLQEQPAIRRPGAAGCAQLERQLTGPEGIGRRVEALGDRRGSQGCRSGAGGLVRRQPVGQRGSGIPSQRGREGEVVAPALNRQEVGLDGLGNQLVPHLHAFVGPFHEESVVDGLRDTRPQVGIQHAVAAPRAGGRTGWKALDEALEGRSDRGELGAIQRPAGGREQPQDPPALGGTPGQAGQDELVERGAE
jgi:hypothetical protein